MGTYGRADVLVNNAFALPSGNIYVSRGLLALANDVAWQENRALEGREPGEALFENLVGGHAVSGPVRLAA